MRTIAKRGFSSIRVEDTEHGIVFSAYDVCRALGIRGVKDVKSWVCVIVEDKDRVIVPVGDKTAMFLTTDGVRRLADIVYMESERRDVFKEWIESQTAIMVVESAQPSRTTLRVFKYDDNDVTFKDKNGVKMVNATQMAKVFGKEIKHWSENQSTTEFVLTLAESRGIEPQREYTNLLKISEVGKTETLNINSLAKLYPSLISVVRGGLGEQGTWLQEDVAIEFARWLSPKFAIWCNDRIKELINNGSVSMSEDEQIRNAMDILNRRVEESQMRLSAANSTISEMRSDYDYMENMVRCDGTYGFNWIAKDLGMRSAKALVDKLISNRIVYRQSKTLLPYAAYSDKGYFVKKSRNYPNRDGEICEAFDTRITEKGRMFLHGIFDTLL